MEEEEVSVGEEEEHDDQRLLVKQDLERHRAAEGQNCRCLVCSEEEASFNRGLRILFLIILTWAVISHFFLGYYILRIRLFGHILIGQTGAILLAVFAAFFVIGVYVKMVMKRIGPVPPRRVQTISALTQQI